jgi:GxxExxY protein
MNADQNISEIPLLHRELTEKVIGLFYEVYNELGHGFLESVYRNSFLIALQQAGLSCSFEVPVPVFFRGQDVGQFRADILVEGKVLIELKAVQHLEKNHEAQLYNYLRATEIEVGLLLNFGPRPEFKRIAFSNERKRIRVHPRSSAVGV